MTERVTADDVELYDDDDDDEYDEEVETYDPPIDVTNAGLVLLAVWLPRFFELQGYVVRDDEHGYRVSDPAKAPRMVHLLQWCVDETSDTPEPALALNKLLCGLPVGVPVVPSIEPTDDELDVCEDVLFAMLNHWEAIEGTSFEGLRETFLQREGRLERRPYGWYLRVQRKTVDVLVDQIPWSTSAVFHRWMDAPVIVQW